MRYRDMTSDETSSKVYRMAARELDPFSAADEVLGRIGL
jgi:hypothetical protein